jgi:uncharacterized iron-regulated membrane protein
MPLRVALSGATPIAFVSADALLLVVAALAGGGAVLIGILAFRARRRAPPAEVSARRAPSPSSVGLADDPIVAALGVGVEQGERPRKP